MNLKLKTLPELKTILDQARARGQKIAVANGCFDLLHVGHVRYLQAAKDMADILVVALNSDRSVAALKGKGRPLMSQEERAEILSAFTCVDYLVFFDELQLDNVLLTLRPHYQVKGTDYTAASVPEEKVVRSYGGEVKIAGDPKDHSTRDLISTILERFGPRAPSL